MTKTESITIAIEDIELKVFYTISKAIKGAKGSCGEPLEPDEDASIDISGIYLVDKTVDIVNLFDYDISAVYEKVSEALADD